jgi:hypothetical protein
MGTIRIIIGDQPLSIDEHQARKIIGEIEQELKKADFPKMTLENIERGIDKTPFGKTTQEYLEALTKEDYCGDNDYDHYIFEEAMKFLYGPDIFDWVNRRL